MDIVAKLFFNKKNYSKQGYLFKKTGHSRCALCRSLIVAPGCPKQAEASKTSKTGGKSTVPKMRIFFFKKPSFSSPTPAPSRRRGGVPSVYRLRNGKKFAKRLVGGENAHFFVFQISCDRRRCLKLADRRQRCKASVSFTEEWEMEEEEEGEEGEQTAQEQVRAKIVFLKKNLFSKKSLFRRELCC